MAKWVLLAATLAPCDAFSQTTEQVGGFNVQFFEPGDNGGNGAYVISGVIPDAQVDAFSAAQKDAIRRSFEYWTDLLDLPSATAQSPTIRVVLRDNVFGINAFGGAVHDTALEQSNPMSRIIDGTNPVRPDGIDAAVQVQDNFGFFTTGSPNQVDGTRTLESVVIHEIAHTLGFVNRNIAHNTTDHTLPGTFESNKPFVDYLTNQSIPDNYAEFFGPNAVAVFGANVPVQPNDTHTIVAFHTMTRAYFDSPVTIFDYRNSPGLLPVELAMMKDLGYDLTLSDHFGSAFYQDGTGSQSTAGASSPTKEYGVGVYLQADNLDLVVTGDQTVTGKNGTGIRIGGGQEQVVHTETIPPTVINPETFNGNTVTIDEGVTLNVSGENGIGVLQSAGSNNVIVHRGSIVASGTNGRGMVFTFGDNTLGFGSGGPNQQLTSDDYDNRVMAERVDLTGQIVAENGAGAAIEIDDSAAFGELNIMQGADIQGDILTNSRAVSDLDGSNYDRPVMNFGYVADANGQRTLVADSNFQFNYDGTINGTNLFEGHLRGGVTEFDGQAAFDTLDVAQVATLGGTGDVGTVGGVANSGTIAPGNGAGIGTLTVFGNVTNAATSNMQIHTSSAGNTAGVHNDLLSVTGNSTFDGGNVTIIADGQEIAVGTIYTFVQANTLTVNTAATFTDNLANRDAVGAFDGTDYWFTIVRAGLLADLGQTPNQLSVGDYLDLVGTDPTVQPLFDIVNNLPFDADVLDALDQLSGEAYGTHLMSRAMGDSNFLDMVNANLRNDGVTCGGYRTPYHPCSFWSHSYGWGAALEDDGNARASNSSAGGTVFGLARNLSDEFFAGAFYGYEGMYLAVDQVRSTVKTDLHRYGLYGQYHTDAGFLRAIGMCGNTSSESSRTVALGGGAALLENNHAQFSGFTGGVDMEAGRTLSGRYAVVTRIAGCRYLRLEQDDFIEQGGLSRLIVDDADLDIFRTRLGADVGVPLTARFNTWASLDAFWQHDFADAVGPYTAGLALADSVRFTARGTHFGRDRLLVTPGLSSTIGHVRLFAKYFLDAGDIAVLHTGAGGFEAVW